MKSRARKIVKELKELITKLKEIDSSNEMASKIEQLKAINKSIQQLENKDIMVPEQLRDLKTNLYTEIEKYEDTKELMDYLYRELKKLVTQLPIRRRRKKGRQKASAESSNEKIP